MSKIKYVAIEANKPSMAALKGFNKNVYIVIKNTHSHDKQDKHKETK